MSDHFDHLNRMIWCYTWIDLSQRVLQSNGKLFSNFKFVFKNLAIRNFFKRIDWIVRYEYWSNCDVLYINGFVSTSSVNKLIVFQISN